MLRVDEYVTLRLHRKTPKEALDAAYQLAEDLPGNFQVMEVHQATEVDKWGAFWYNVNLAPDWRGYDGS